jgi:hypothetical protein
MQVNECSPAGAGQIFDVEDDITSMNAFMWQKNTVLVREFIRRYFACMREPPGIMRVVTGLPTQFRMGY